MSIATLNVKVSPRRMLNLREAADYCSLSSKRFPAECTVAPVEIGGSKVYDIRDLDNWIDGLKGSQSETDDDILARLS